MTNRFYEGMFLVDANWASNSWDEVSAFVTGLVEKTGGKVRRMEIWGDRTGRKLAYPIRIERTLHRRGTYVLTALELPTGAPNTIMRDAELDTRCLRTLLLQKRDDEIERIFEPFPEVDVRRGRREDGEDGESERSGDEN